ncbi:hypothetical protein [Paraburkholderia youngii]|uniref:hypothetical protein n=1 Tax=Paraburkholderia youngii TaxID=2782701 RepID=UPI001FE7CAEF|nr:hypothetical protein [Paraburkholderia youngii]
MAPLRERMQHDMLIRNLADNTQKSYLLQVSCFARHFGRSPELLGPEEYDDAAREPGPSGAFDCLRSHHDADEKLRKVCTTRFQRVGRLPLASYQP